MGGRGGSPATAGEVSATSHGEVPAPFVTSHGHSCMCVGGVEASKRGQGGGRQRLQGNGPGEGNGAIRNMRGSQRHGVCSLALPTSSVRAVVSKYHSVSPL